MYDIKVRMLIKKYMNDLVILFMDIIFVNIFREYKFYRGRSNLF